MLGKLFGLKPGTTRSMISKHGYKNENRKSNPKFKYDLEARMHPEKLLVNNVDVTFSLGD